jgi:hypothetical protein
MKAIALFSNIFRKQKKSPLFTAFEARRNWAPFQNPHKPSFNSIIFPICIAFLSNAVQFLAVLKHICARIVSNGVVIPHDIAPAAAPYMLDLIGVGDVVAVFF